MSLVWDTDQQSGEACPHVCVCVPVKRTRGGPKSEEYTSVFTRSPPSLLFPHKISSPSLTSGLNAELRLVTLLAGHCKPAVVWVLNPLSSLAIEQALVHWLQLVNGQPVGRGTGFVKPEVPCSHPLPVRSPGAQNKIPWQGDQLLRWGSCVLRGPQVPTHRQVSVLHCGARHLAGKLQCVALHLGQSLGWSCYC